MCALSRVAMDRDGVVQWLVGDHLGTTSVVLNANGTVHSEARHYPYGEERWSSGTLLTDYRFTGQRSESGLGLVHMGARRYDPALARWVSADTIVPEPGSPQSSTGMPMCGIHPSGTQIHPGMRTGPEKRSQGTQSRDCPKREAGNSSLHT